VSGRSPLRPDCCRPLQTFTVSLTGPTELEIRTPLVTAFMNIGVKLQTPDTDLRGTVQVPSYWAPNFWTQGTLRV